MNNVLILLIIVLVFGVHRQGFPQSFARDLELMKQSHRSEPPIVPKQRLSLNPAKLLLTFYQKVASPQLSANCIFEVSCSRFSRELIAEFGLVKGVALTADRLARCNKHTHRAAPKVRKIQTPRGIKIIDKPLYYSLKEYRKFEKNYLRW